MMDEASQSASHGPDPAPVGQGSYVVEPGDCMESIAYAHGFFWKTLWNLPENGELKSKRNPNILLPGDLVTVPAVRPFSESRPTDAQHKFKRKGAICKLSLRFLDEKMEPRKYLKYRLTIDDDSQWGYLDGGGALNVAISPNASHASIRLETTPDPERYELDLGQLDPLDTPTGVRARLINLGFACAPDGPWDADVQAALRNYQQVRGLEVNGTLNDDTKNSLKNDYLS